MYAYKYICFSLLIVFFCKAHVHNFLSLNSFLINRYSQKNKRSNAYSITLEKLIENMLKCDGDPGEGWRRPDGFWAKLVLMSGLKNTSNERRAMYDLWKKNWNGRTIRMRQK